MPSQFIHTANSVYEHDPANRRIRRLEPTARQTEGWRAYEVILVQHGDRMVIAWGTNDDGSLATTVTSPILLITDSRTKAVA